MTDANDPRSVFVVHGRNEPLRRSMFEFLCSIGLNPIEWTQAIAMTGEASPYIGSVLDAALARAAAIVVLMSPDEVAYLQTEYANGPNDPESQPAPQARPNVLFEAGMALGRDARRTVLVEVGEVRPFSDVAGRHVVRLNNDLARRQDLAARLKTAGCVVELSGTDWHAAGDFSAPPAPGGGLPLGRRVPSQARASKRIDFDLKYYTRGGNQMDKLQVINRGIEDALDVTLAVPDGAALDLTRAVQIRKIPGAGKSVTLDVLSHNRTMGPRSDESFDVIISGFTTDGESVAQTVFLDMNG